MHEHWPVPFVLLIDFCLWIFILGPYFLRCIGLTFCLPFLVHFLEVLFQTIIVLSALVINEPTSLAAVYLVQSRIFFQHYLAAFSLSWCNGQRSCLTLQKIYHWKLRPESCHMPLSNFCIKLALTCQVNILKKRNTTTFVTPKTQPLS